MMRLLTLCLVLALGGCGWLGKQEWIRDRSHDYRKAKIEPELRVPPGLDSGTLQDIYVIPPTNQSLAVAEGEFEVPRPTPLVSRESEEMVRIQRLGDEEWMLANVAPGQLWPQLRAYLSTRGMQVARVDARAGIIETTWFQGPEADMNERYRFRIEQGVQRNTAELHVLQMYQVGDAANWPETSSDSERSGDMLLSVAQYIASATEEAPVSMMAQQAMGEGGKVNLLEDPDGTTWVQLKLPYYRAWASVDRALRESSFEVRDLDRSSGVFYVRFIPPEEEDGWFSWMFGSDKEAEAVGDQDFLITLSERGETDVRNSCCLCSRAISTDGGVRTRTPDTLMRFGSLGSGSRGNATLVEAGGTRLLVDCGFSVRETERRLARLGLEAGDLDAVLVTHEHSDHCAGVAALSRKYRLPVYLTRGTEASGRCDGAWHPEYFHSDACFDRCAPRRPRALSVRARQRRAAAGHTHRPGQRHHGSHRALRGLPRAAAGVQSR